MVDGNNATGARKGLVQDVLAHAYRDRFAMEMRLKLNLDESYGDSGERLPHRNV